MSEDTNLSKDAVVCYTVSSLQTALQPDLLPWLFDRHLRDLSQSGAHVAALRSRRMTYLFRRVGEIVYAVQVRIDGSVCMVML